MRSLAILVIILVAGGGNLWAQKASAILGDVETEWPGIHFHVFRIIRIPGDRLLVGVRIVATPQAPGQGTLIGIEPKIPPDATPADIQAGRYNPAPFSLESSTMVEEKTSRKFATAQPGPNSNHISGEILCSLRPSQAETLAIEFPSPPVEYDSKGQPVKQFVSIFLTKAKAEIPHIPVPLPLTSASPTPKP